MNVIFLDIDGVLNSGPFLEQDAVNPIERKNAEILKSITESTGAAIVLSSGWKSRLDDNMNPLTEGACRLNNTLREFGIKLFGKTPDFSTEEIRKDRTFSKVKAKEIKVWLGLHEDVERFVVLDDLDLNDAEINKRTIRISSMTGLTEDDAGRAIDMLTLSIEK